MTQREVKT